MAVKYVDPILGSDTTGDGSAATPWQTQSHAMAAMAASDTLQVVGPGRLEEMFHRVLDYATNTLKTNATIGDEVTANQGTQGASPWLVAETSTPITGQSLEAGGVGLLGWLSSIRTRLLAILGATDGAAVVTDANGTLQQYLRGLVKWAFERMPAALGQGTMAQSLSVTIANNQTYPAQECATVAEYNIPLTNADAEYSQALPANCRKVTFRCRRAVEIRYAWVTGKVAGSTAPYQTLKAGANNSVDGIKPAGATLYFACSGGNEVVEMEAWT